ncbi:MAG: Ig-like domain-containing protein [Planctomycetaceae bacterium]|jgi:hypothetical protein|nr:Ig-like domain-containing protein [Planctomycetaceae bacterium]
MRQILIAFLGMIFLVGCGTANPYNAVYVEGIVVCDGTPAANVHVTFVSTNNDGNSASGMTDDSGKYKLTTGGAPYGTGALPALYNVTLSKFEVEGANLSEEEYKEQIGNRQPKVIHLIPEKYSDPETSGIEQVKVEKGKKNIFNFNISTRADKKTD